MLKKIKFLLLLLFSFSVSADNSVIEVISLQNRPAAEIQPIVAPLLDASDSIIPNGFNLIVTTTPEKLDEIKALVKKLDSALTNLKITVIQSKNTNADELNAGANANIHVPIHKPSDTQAQINAYYEQQQRQRNNHNEQVLRVLEGTPAYIKAGKQHPIHTTTYSSGFRRHTVTRQTELVEASTGFAVLPRLNGEQVILEVTPWSDAMQRHGEIETQTAQTTITTHLDEWVEIGAIDEQQDSKETGLLSHQQGNKTERIRIMIKVEKAN